MNGEMLEIVEWFVESAIKHEQSRDEQERPIDHDRRLAIAGVVAQMRQADALERIGTQLECVTEQIMATWQHVADVSGQLEVLASVASAWEDRLTPPLNDSAYEDTSIGEF